MIRLAQLAMFVESVSVIILERFGNVIGFVLSLDDLRHVTKFKPPDWFKPLVKY